MSFFCYLDCVCQFLGPMEATFWSWILSSGLSYGHKLRASNLKHKNSCFHHQKTLFVEGCLVRQLYYSFVVLTRTFCPLRGFESFSISDTGCLIFHLMSFFCYPILFVSVWGSMEATFSTWILSSGLSYGHKLRASNLKHKNSCFHHQKTLFVEGCLVRQLYYSFLVLTRTFCPLRGFESFSISDTGCLIFHLMSFFCYPILFVSVWGSMEATFSTWILSSGLSYGHKLRASNLKHEDSCFHHLQTCLWKRTSSNNYIFCILF